MMAYFFVGIAVGIGFTLCFLFIVLHAEEL